MSPDARVALRRLLLSAFDTFELRRLVRYLPDGDTLSYGLPAGSVSAAQLVEGVIDTAEREGRVDDLLTAARAERPRRAHEVDAVRQQVSAPATPSPAPATPTPGPSPAPAPSSTAPAGPGYDIFLAHASPDKPRARTVHRLLTDRGLRCFFDEESVKPGANWMQAIPEALQSSRVVVVLISRSMTDAWYANSEIISAVQLARTANLTIIPVYLDGRSKNAPYGLEALQALNAADLGLDEVARRIADVARPPTAG